MNAEDFGALLENRTVWISFGLVAFLIWNNLKSKKGKSGEPVKTEQAPKNHDNIQVTQDVENTDNDWFDTTPSMKEDSQDDAFSRSVEEEAKLYSSEAENGGNYKNGVDI